MTPFRHRSRLLPVMFALIVVASAPSNVAGEDLRKPASWEEFTAYLADGGDFGMWESSGVTTDVWKTLPPGIRYRYRAQVGLDESGRQVVRTFTYVDDQGKLLSSGSEIIVWDAKSGMPKKAMSGLDEGRPWSAFGRMVGFDDSRTVFSSEETGDGKTYELLTTFERTGENTRRRTVARADGKEIPFVQEFTRVNPLVEALGGWDPTGTWNTDMGGVVFVNEARWSADRRCVVTTEGVRLPDGSLNVTGNGLMWFDLDARVIRQKYVTGMGMVLDGEVLKASKDRLVMRFTGIDPAGVALHAIITSTVEGDRMTSSFSDMTYDGHARTPVWARQPMVATRSRK
ncbi:MAG: hypothetical protein GY895_19310 [Phycisphaera sp.]|nr:hypothetical protein [Phycisphaera sp.]